MFSVPDVQVIFKICDIPNELLTEYWRFTSKCILWHAIAASSLFANTPKSGRMTLLCVYLPHWWSYQSWNKPYHKHHVIKLQRQIGEFHWHEKKKKFPIRLRCIYSYIGSRLSRLSYIRVMNYKYSFNTWVVMVCKGVSEDGSRLYFLIISNSFYVNTVYILVDRIVYANASMASSCSEPIYNNCV